MSDIQKRGLVMAIWLAASFLFAVFFIEDFVRDILIRPMMYTAWVAEFFVRSLPQYLFWGLFVFGAAIWGLRLIRFRAPRRPRMRTVAIGQQGPVARWQGQLRRARVLDYGRFNLNRSLRKLVLDLTVTEAEADLSGPAPGESPREPDVPDELRSLLIVRGEEEFGRRSLMDRLLDLVPKPRAELAEHRRAPEAVVRYLEDRLGMAGRHQGKG